MFKKFLSSLAVIALLSSTTALAQTETTGLTASQISSGAAGTVTAVEGGFVVGGTFVSTAAAVGAGLLAVLGAAAFGGSGDTTGAAIGHSGHSGHSGHGAN